MLQEVTVYHVDQCQIMDIIQPQDHVIGNAIMGIQNQAAHALQINHVEQANIFHEGFVLLAQASQHMHIIRQLEPATGHAIAGITILEIPVSNLQLPVD